MSGIAMLPPHLERQLDRIVPSRDGELEYYPCAVTLDDGSVHDRVYIVEEGPFLRRWGVHPARDRGKAAIPIERVTLIRESPFRLPPRLANELCAAGESGMGYCIFVVEFKGGLLQAYVTGNAVDFIVPPPGKSAADARRVYPHKGREMTPQRGPAYAWCLYRGAS